MCRDLGFSSACLRDFQVVTSAFPLCRDFASLHDFDIRCVAVPDRPLLGGGGAIIQQQSYRSSRDQLLTTSNWWQ